MGRIIRKKGMVYKAATSSSRWPKYSPQRTITKILLVIANAIIAAIFSFFSNVYALKYPPSMKHREAPQAITKHLFISPRFAEMEIELLANTAKLVTAKRKTLTKDL